MKRLFVSVLATAGMVASFAVAANAAKPHRVLATPKAACQQLVAVGTYPSFRNCMATINQDVASFRYFDEEVGALLSLDERCAAFEATFLTYPFYFDEGPDWPFTTFTARNHRQCMFALYTYHSLFG
jgi:hypothetical protein